MKGPLAERRVLVTRPAGQGEALVQRLRDRGADVLYRPTLIIEPLAPEPTALGMPSDWIVFTSPNAVRHGHPWLLTRGSGGRTGFPRVAAVGPGTAAAARALGFTVDVAPRAGGGADDLLAESEFQPAAGERVLIIRGQGGRRRLQDELKDGGVEIAEAEVYRRCPVNTALTVPADWRCRDLDVTIVTSRAGLTALLGMADPDTLKWLQGSGLVTVSERVATAAQQAGFQRPRVAAGAADAELEQAAAEAVRRDAHE